MASTTSTTASPQTSPLLALPMELLQHILLLVQSSARIKLHPRSKGKLISQPLAATAQVCHQLHADCQARLFRNTSTINALLQDFNFRHLASFLTNLEDQQLQSFVTTTAAPNASADPDARTRRLHVKFEISRGCEWTGLGSSLERWLRRMADPIRHRGANTEVHYAACAEVRRWLKREAWLWVAHDYAEGRPGQSDGEEMEKILQVVRSPLTACRMR